MISKLDKLTIEEKTIIEMKKTVISDLEEHISIIKSVRNISDTIVKTADIIINTYELGGKIILIGNGGSASDAQHIAAEFVGRFKKDRPSLNAMALTTNTSIITALANDYGYENIFSRQLESIVSDKDILIAITTSGNSANILNAAKSAKLRNMKVIGMTGKSGGILKEIADIMIQVQSDNTPRIQETHITIGHIICNLVENHLFDSTMK